MRCFAVMILCFAAIGCADSAEAPTGERGQELEACYTAYGCFEGQFLDSYPGNWTGTGNVFSEELDNGNVVYCSDSWEFCGGPA
jgi:hypothetical protein